MCYFLESGFSATDSFLGLWVFYITESFFGKVGFLCY